MRTTAFPLAHCSPDFLVPSRNHFAVCTRRSTLPKNYSGKLVQTKWRPSVSFRCCSIGHGAAAAGGGGEEFSQQHESQNQQKIGFLKKWQEKSAEMSSKAAKLGMSAVLAYGLFDAVTYTSFFVLAFLGYEKSTGKNPAANIQALLGIVILMWTGNNVTRPFRVAGAAALAPVIDRGLRKIQNYFNLPTLVYAFGLVVGIVASVCLTVVGLLILSRWGK